MLGRHVGKIPVNVHPEVGTHALRVELHAVVRAFAVRRRHDHPPSSIRVDVLRRLVRRRAPPVAALLVRPRRRAQTLRKRLRVHHQAVVPHDGQLASLGVARGAAGHAREESFGVVVAESVDAAVHGDGCANHSAAVRGGERLVAEAHAEDGRSDGVAEEVRAHADVVWVFGRARSRGEDHAREMARVDGGSETAPRDGVVADDRGGHAVDGGDEVVEVEGVAVVVIHEEGAIALPRGPAREEARDRGRGGRGGGRGDDVVGAGRRSNAEGHLAQARGDGVGVGDETRGVRGGERAGEPLVVVQARIVRAGERERGTARVRAEGRGGIRVGERIRLVRRRRRRGSLVLARRRGSNLLLHLVRARGGAKKRATALDDGSRHNRRVAVARGFG